MTINLKNQNEIYEIFGINYKYENAPIIRTKTKPKVEDKHEKLANLRKKIEIIKNCELKSFANNLVFSDGNENSSIMFVGEGPGEKEDELGKPFVGEAGLLLNKMLNAIKLERKSIYVTNVVNYRPPNNRKPSPEEITRYTEFLREHILIIDPKLLILMGSTAMEAFFGFRMKITKSRGKWRELIINEKIIKTMLIY